VGKSLSHDLILGSQPTIKGVDVGIGHNEVHIRVWSCGLQSEELAAPAPTSATVKPACSIIRSASIARLLLPFVTRG